MNKNVIISVLVVIVLVAAGYLLLNRKTDTVKPVEQKTDAVATVNGVAIPKAAFDAQLATALTNVKAQGVDVTDAAKLAQIKTQVLDDLIGNELINQGVAKAGIQVTPAEVETQYQAILKQAGSAEALAAELTKNNLTEAQFRENISKQLAVQAYLLQNIDVKSITVSDAEIAQFYADYSKAQKDAGQKTVPALKELSEQIKQQITTNKQQTLIVNFVASLRAAAKVEIAAQS
ncbi:MAG: SurA N-terminal domain-containing protein [Minisyncoccota bacterium]